MYHKRLTSPTSSRRYVKPRVVRHIIMPIIRSSVNSPIRISPSIRISPRVNSQVSTTVVSPVLSPSVPIKRRVKNLFISFKTTDSNISSSSSLSVGKKVIQDLLYELRKYTDHNLLIQECLIESKLNVLVLSINFAQQNSYGLYETRDKSKAYFSPLLRDMYSLYMLDNEEVVKFATHIYTKFNESLTTKNTEITAALSDTTENKRIAKEVLDSAILSYTGTFSDTFRDILSKITIKNGYKLDFTSGDIKIPQVSIEIETVDEFKERCLKFLEALSRIVKLFEDKNIVIALQEIEPYSAFLSALDSVTYLKDKFSLVDSKTLPDGQSKTILFTNFGTASVLAQDTYAQSLANNVNKNTIYSITHPEIREPITIYNVHINYGVATKTDFYSNLSSKLDTLRNTIVVGDFNVKQIPDNTFKFDFVSVDTPEYNFYKSTTTKDLIVISRDVKFVDNTTVEYAMEDIIDDRKTKVDVSRMAVIKSNISEDFVYRRIGSIAGPQSYGNFMINKVKVVK